MQGIFSLRRNLFIVFIYSVAISSVVLLQCLMRKDWLSDCLAYRCNRLYNPHHRYILYRYLFTKYCIFFYKNFESIHEIRHSNAQHNKTLCETEAIVDYAWYTITINWSLYLYIILYIRVCHSFYPVGYIPMLYLF